MNDKQILDRLESINLSLRQKQDLIDVIKDIADNNTSNDNGSNDNNILYVYADAIEQKILINNVEYELSEPDGGVYGETLFNIKNETLYNYIKNYYDKNYYAYVTVVFSNRNTRICQKGNFTLSHIIYEGGDCFDIVLFYDYFALVRIGK